MKTFKELIDSGIAATKATFWGKTLPGNLASQAGRICNEYNSTYGQASSTTLSPKTDESNVLILTGETVRNGETWWNEFLNSQRWHDVDFCCPLCQWLKDYNLGWKWIVINGAPVIAIKKIDNIEK